MVVHSFRWVTTVTRLRELLESVGMTFAEHPDPATADYARTHALRRLPDEQRAAARAGLPDYAAISRLGLRGSTMARTKKAGLNVVGDLRRASLRDLYVRFGRSEVREIIAARAETGQGLRSNPSQLELWRAGVLDLAALEKPIDQAATVLELRPWIGAVVERLHAAGVRTLGELRAAAAAGPLCAIRGVGDHSEERVRVFLGLSPGSKAPAGSVIANSVFRVGANGSPSSKSGQ